MSGAEGASGGADVRVDHRLLDALVHHVDEALVAFDADGTITWASRGVRLLLGHEPAAVVGDNVLSLIHPDELDGLADAITRWAGRSGSPRGEVITVQAADGSWVAVRYDAVTGPEVAALGTCVVTLRAIEAGVEAAAELRARDEASARVVRLASLFLHRGARPFGSALGEAVQELSGLEWVTRLSVWRSDGDRVRRQAAWSATVSAPTTPLPRQLPIAGSRILGRLDAGEEVHIRSVRHLPDDWRADRQALLAAGVRSLLAVPMVIDGRCTGFVLAEVTLADIGFDAVHLLTMRSAAAVLAAAFEREDVEAELERRARTDPLTGLANRFAFDEMLEAALVGLAAGEMTGVSVGIIDLDRFKVVNDALGHVAGDRLLAEVIARLADATPPHTTVARLGGDELLVLHEQAASADDAMVRTRTMLAVLDVPVEVGGRPHVLTASAGVAFTDDASVGRVEMLRRADVAMYQAKDAGGDRVVGDDAQLRAEVGRRLQREAELRSAIDDGGLVVHYQGEWDLTTGELVGAEALARWEHPVEGLLAAGAFIPLAEECGLVEPLGERVLRQACAQVAAWKADGLASSFLLRVNLSARQLRDHHTVDLVAEVLDETGLATGDLCLELTESAILVDPEGAVRTLQALRGLGVGLAVDDFGTGYSSMLYLKRLPITALKVDQAFVAGLPDDLGDVAIVQSTVQLADLLGLALTAEGVETTAQRDALVRLGCRHAQGFGLARPEPADVFVDRLR